MKLNQIFKSKKIKIFIFIFLLNNSYIQNSSASELNSVNDKISINSSQRDVLAKIEKTKNIVLAVREGSIPFSYNDGNDNYIGYSVELCEMIAKQIRKELNLDLLNVTYLPVEASERMEVVKNGMADMECGSTSNTGERQKTYGFSLGIIAVETLFLSNKKININSEEDLISKKIAVTNNTIGQSYIKELNATKKLKIRPIIYKDNYEAFLSILDGNSDLTANDDVLLAALLASTSPEIANNFHLTGKGFNLNTYGIVLPKNDQKFKDMVDKILISILTSNKIIQIYNKWFLSPIPPKNIIIGLSPNKATLEIFKTPHDRALIEK